jgi:signal transduction histidine kinase
MEAQDKQVDGMPAPEVIAALLDLARLLHRVAFAASEAPDTIAPLLLERLVILCKAQRGAILFTTQSPPEQKPSFWASANELKDVPQARLQSPTNAGQTLRTLALHDMKEEEVFAQLEGFSSDGAAIQSPAGEPCCLICRLPISAPIDQDGGVTQSLATPNPAETRLAGASPGRPQGLYTQSPGQHPNSLQLPPLQMLPSNALLVLVWDAVRGDSVATEDGICIAAESAKRLLPWIMDAAGTIIMHVLLVERVHELEAVAERKALRDMELLKAELLATVSHELRSPLASIKGYAATLLRHERRISREERHEFLLAITEASDRLLEMSQLETGDITLELTAVNLAYLVREAITAVEQRLIAPEHLDRQCTLTLYLENERGMPTTEEPVIWADRHRLREVLDNLVENAIHYSRDGGAIEITIRPIFTPSHTIIPPAPQDIQPMVEIAVRDHGIGIPRAHLGRIFERFHRVDTGLTREVNGLGLGLAVCKRIVELHGGTIWAESDIGQGSTFHVWLPVDARLSR